MSSSNFYTVGDLVAAPGRPALPKKIVQRGTFSCLYKMTSGICLSTDEQSNVSVFMGDRIIEYPSHMVMRFDKTDMDVSRRLTIHCEPDWFKAWS